VEKIIWSPIATQDLREIYHYIREDSELYASRLIDKIVERIEILRKMPRAGKVVVEFEDENIRELIEGNYRIIYLIAADSIEIVRIHHGARLLK
jgi:addiction module RelE/StbE family toxin